MKNRNKVWRVEIGTDYERYLSSTLFWEESNAREHVKTLMDIHFFEPLEVEGVYYWRKGFLDIYLDRIEIK